MALLLKVLWITDLASLLLFIEHYFLLYYQTSVAEYQFLSLAQSQRWVMWINVSRHSWVDTCNKESSHLQTWVCLHTFTYVNKFARFKCSFYSQSISRVDDTCLAPLGWLIVSKIILESQLFLFNVPIYIYVGLHIPMCRWLGDDNLCLLPLLHNPLIAFYSFIV